eukprot:scaffold50558_cov30-Tisochrysis_lutea.AAC.11
MAWTSQTHRATSASATGGQCHHHTRATQTPSSVRPHRGPRRRGELSSPWPHNWPDVTCPRLGPDGELAGSPWSSLQLPGRPALSFGPTSPALGDEHASMTGELRTIGRHLSYSVAATPACGGRRIHLRRPLFPLIVAAFVVSRATPLLETAPTPCTAVRSHSCMIQSGVAAELAQRAHIVGPQPALTVVHHAKRTTARLEITPL